VSAYGDRRLLPAILFGVVTVVGFFFTVVVHGYAHLAIAKLFGAPRSRARLTIFGDTSDPAPGQTSVAVAAAGPVASLLIGTALLVAAGRSAGSLEDISRTIGLANLGVAAVNLVPGLPMDAGRILAAVTGRPRFAAMLGRFFALVSVVIGGLLVYARRADVSVAALGLWLVLVGVFVLVEARAPRRDPVPTIDLHGQTVAGWTRAFIGRVGADDPIPAGEGPYAVSDEGRLAGVLTGPGVRGGRARDSMIPWTSELGIRADAPLERAIDRLASGQQPLIVIDEKGVVRGVLDEVAVRSRLVER
jgi:Zn-dependent protease